MKNVTGVTGVSGITGDKITKLPSSRAQTERSPNTTRNNKYKFHTTKNMDSIPNINNMHNNNAHTFNKFIKLSNKKYKIFCQDDMENETNAVNAVVNATESEQVINFLYQNYLKASSLKTESPLRNSNNFYENSINIEKVDPLLIDFKLKNMNSFTKNKKTKNFANTERLSSNNVFITRPKTTIISKRIKINEKSHEYKNKEFNNNNNKNKYEKSNNIVLEAQRELNNDNNNYNNNIKPNSSKTHRQLHVIINPLANTQSGFRNSNQSNTVNSNLLLKSYKSNKQLTKPSTCITERRQPKLIAINKWENKIIPPKIKKQNNFILVGNEIKSKLIHDLHFHGKNNTNTGNIANIANLVNKSNVHQRTSKESMEIIKKNNNIADHLLKFDTIPLNTNFSVGSQEFEGKPSPRKFKLLDKKVDTDYQLDTRLSTRVDTDVLHDTRYSSDKLGFRYHNNTHISTKELPFNYNLRKIKKTFMLDMKRNEDEVKKILYNLRKDQIHCDESKKNIASTLRYAKLNKEKLKEREKGWMIQYLTLENDRKIKDMKL